MKKIVIAFMFGLFAVTMSNAQETIVASAKVEQASKAEASFQCPMDCEKGKTYAKEGSCPVCKMDLKKVSVKEAKAGCSGKKAKGCCAGKKAASKASCGSKAKTSCAGKSKASCAGKAKKGSSEKM